MSGLAERYWRDLRPSAAGRFRLDAGARYDREGTGRGRGQRRPRRHLRPALRTSSR